MDTDIPISIPEAYYLLSKNKSQKKIFQTTYDYVSKFAKIKDKNKIEDLVLSFEGMNLDRLVVSDIISLFPQSSHEYKSIIRGELDDSKIEKVIQKLKEYF